MSALSTISIVFYTIIALTLIGNFIRLIIETKKLKEKDQTPLTGKTVITILVASIAELIVVFLLLKIVAVIGLGSVISVVFDFILLHYGRHIAAYLATWATWSVFVRRMKTEELTKIQQEMKKGTS